MTVPDFSVLLLAWDEADPSVAVHGGAALPPTLPLVYQLAAQQPVLAVFPHLPAGPGQGGAEAATPNAAATAAPPGAPEASAAAAPAAANPLRALVPAPGVRLLSVTALPSPEAPPATAGAASRLVGLAELAPLAAPDDSPAPPLSPRSQWPTDARSPRAGAGQVPAAPYLGSALATTAPQPPPGPLLPHPVSTFAAPTPAGGLAPNDPSPAHPPTGDLRFGPASELPAAVPQPANFDEAPPEVGPAEAADLFTPADDLSPESATPAHPAAALTPPASVTTLAPAPGSARPRVPALDGLNARMIQYARHAAQLVHGRADYAVIYAPNWPAWLAALEIRNRTGRPLVLYVATLATDFAAPAERGWLLEIERMTLRRAHLILVPTKALGARLRAQYGATVGRIQVVAAHDEAEIRRVLSAAAGQ